MLLVNMKSQDIKMWYRSI